MNVTKGKKIVKHIKPKFDVGWNFPGSWSSAFRLPFIEKPCASNDARKIKIKTPNHRNVINCDILKWHTTKKKMLYEFGQKYDIIFSIINFKINVKKDTFLVEKKNYDEMNWEMNASVQ